MMKNILNVSSIFVLQIVLPVEDKSIIDKRLKPHDKPFSIAAQLLSGPLCSTFFKVFEKSDKFNLLEEKEMMLELVSYEMEHAMELLVPLKAEATASNNWYEAK